MKRSLVLVLIVCCFPLLATAADREVSAVANAIEQAYGLKQKYLPWIARATMKPFLMGSGVSINFALFEDQPLPRSASLQDLQDLTDKALGREWSLFVRADSRRDGERTLIYVKLAGKRMLMLIVAAERDETTVLKMKLKSADALTKLAQPEKLARGNSKSDRASD